jgi:RNA polymerase-binding transcription factor DksA
VPEPALGAPSEALPLTGVQRAQLGDLIRLHWREQVHLITELAVDFHSAAERSAARKVLGEELAGVRRRLVDLETALRRLSSGSYGRCDGCERRIPFEHLEARPEVMFCRRCRPADDPAAQDGAVSA